MANKELQIWNGRMAHPYKHGYVAAYSRADAIRVMAEALGYSSCGMDSELKNYWNEGAWGNNMIGITPERGLWAQKTDNGDVFRIINKKALPVTNRTAEWDEFQAKQQAELDAFRQAELNAKAKRAELRELFADQSPFPDPNTVRVNDAEWSEHKGKYNVTFYGLTEAEVRTLAEKAKP